MVTVAAWADAADLPAGTPAPPGGDPQRDELILAASRLLYALSGRRWEGDREVTLEVVASGSPAWAAVGGGLGWSPSWGACVVDGEVYNHDRCGRPPSVRLPGDHITAVTTVAVGGTVRDPATYRLTKGWLEDRTGRGWPTCDPGVVVTYRLGLAPPPDGRTAAAELASELIRAAAGQETRLPGNVTSITRQGITMGVRPGADLFEKGNTGLPLTDLWLATVNPKRLARRASSWSPDTATRTYPQEAPQ